MEMVREKLFVGGFDLLAWQEQGLFELLAKGRDTLVLDEKQFVLPSFCGANFSI